MEKETGNRFEGRGLSGPFSGLKNRVFDTVLLRSPKMLSRQALSPKTSGSRGCGSFRGLGTLRYSASGFFVLLRCLNISKKRGFGVEGPFSNFSFSLFLTPIPIPIPILILILFLTPPSSAQSSYFQFPVSVPYTWMDSYIDKEMQGVLYADTSYADQSADHLKVSVRKIGKLSISGFTEYALVRMPLRIAISKELPLFNLNTDFDIELVLKTRISLDSTWHLRSATKVVEYTITRNPVLPLGGKTIDVKYLLKLALDGTLPKMVPAIDEAIYSSTVLRDQAASYWKQVQQPTMVDTSYKAWMSVTPISCGLAPVVFQSAVMQIHLSMNLQLMTCVGFKPAMGKLTGLPNLKSIQGGEDRLQMRMPVWLSYPEISRQATAYLKDTVFQITKKRSIQVDSVGVESLEDKLRITVLTSGALRSSLVFEGRPMYDTLALRLSMYEFKYDFKTKQALPGLANRLFRSRIRKRMQDAFQYELTNDLNEYRRQANAYLKVYVYENQVKVTGELNSLNLKTFKVRPDYLMLMLDIEGKTQVQLVGPSR